MQMGTSDIRRRLRELAAGPPTSTSRGEVMRGLASGFESIRDEAARTLATWDDPESVAAPRDLPGRGHDSEPFAWVNRDTAMKALARCAGSWTDTSP